MTALRYPTGLGRKSGKGFGRLGRPIRLDPKRFGTTNSELTGQLGAVSNMITYIAQQKVEKTSDAMIRLAKAERWPEDPKEIIGYIGRSSESRAFRNDNPKSVTNDANYLINYSLKYPLKTYDKTFRFEPIAVGSLEALNDAAQSIMARFFQYSVQLPARFTGQYRRSVKMYVRKGVEDMNPKPYFPGMLEGMGRSAQILIASSDPGGSSIEAHFVERAKQGGMLFQAARDVRKKYKQLKIKYFAPPADKLGLPYDGSRIYGIPVVIVSLRGQGTQGRLSRPGRNIRRRGSARASGVANSYGAKQYHSFHRELRKRAGYKRTDERNYGDSLYSYRGLWRRRNKKRRGN